MLNEVRNKIRYKVRAWADTPTDEELEAMYQDYLKGSNAETMSGSDSWNKPKGAPKGAPRVFRIADYVPAEAVPAEAVPAESEVCHE